ncbi:hypothetical protein AcdelDRAFT_0048 [Acidovorax delafieldii 2AN]|jgi:GTP-binding protein EngB required for normal cell division|uniref:Dynamin N-terminal domain-containing protein n=1 Tax=Acidovorax delafieldii 2AN TaxID=573060 RepID=C5SZG8_ACIDE|nr:dynamin family protein [Acidovorax delafieldii]EER62364.1 hypothetical protein AcdelDRAFT_0048 [Acidovorax delafieldii 2AN]
MAPDTLERQLLPALEQLGRFWVLRRRKWVHEARQGIRATDQQTARLVQEQAALTVDLERHKAALLQLQADHGELGERLRARTDAHAALTAAHAAVQGDAQALCDELGATVRNLATLQTAHSELEARHQVLTQMHAQQGSALEQQQAKHRSLLIAHAALEHNASESQRQLCEAIDESKVQQAALANLREAHQKLLLDLRQHQEWLQQETANRESLFQENKALSLHHETLIGRHDRLVSAHQAVMQQFHVMAGLLGLTPEHATGEDAPLVTKISALLEREELVRWILSAPPRATDACHLDHDPRSNLADHVTSLPSFLDWLGTRLAPALGESHLPAEEVARALGRARELEAAVAVLEDTPQLRDKFVVAVAGGFSSGKSSFITSFIQDRAVELPIGIQPVTSIPTYVMAGNSGDIRGHTYRGGEISISGELYKGLSHDFVHSLGFNLRDILPYVTVETTLRGLNHLAFVDLPGYDAAASEGACTATDGLTATDFIEGADAIVWVVGLDSNGTLPDTDLALLDKLSTGERPLHVVLNKADLRAPEQVTEVLEQLHVLLKQAQIQYVGLSAYSSELGEELQFQQQSLFETLERWDRPGKPVARVLRQFDELMDQLELAVESTCSKRASMADTLHSLRLDFQELLSHLPTEDKPRNDQEAELEAYVNPVSGVAEVKSHTETQSEDSARLACLQKDANERLSQLQSGLSGGVDQAAARRLLAQMRQEGMDYLQQRLK